MGSAIRLGEGALVGHPKKPSIAFKISEGSSGRNQQSFRQLNDLFKAGRVSICYLGSVHPYTLKSNLKLRHPK